MPWIPMYLAADDVVGVLEMLNADEEVAFLVKDGPNRWKAILSVPTLPPGRIAIWHIPSGPLPLLAADKQQHDGQVQDAFSGWNELLIGADPTTPYFGAGHPGVIWLNLHVSPSERNSVGGMSSFEWIGTTTASSEALQQRRQNCGGSPCVDESRRFQPRCPAKVSPVRHRRFLLIQQH